MVGDKDRRRPVRSADMPVAAASSKEKPNSRASEKVMKMPNCAAAPKSIIFGLDSSGPKSIIAPIPMNKINGNSSFAIPALYKVSSVSTAPETGMLTRIAPKPIGSSSAGSISFLMAR